MNKWEAFTTIILIIAATILLMFFIVKAQACQVKDNALYHERAMMDKMVEGARSLTPEEQEKFIRMLREYNWINPPQEQEQLPQPSQE